MEQGEKVFKLNFARSFY